MSHHRVTPLVKLHACMPGTLNGPQSPGSGSSLELFKFADSSYVRQQLSVIYIDMHSSKAISTTCQSCLGTLAMSAS